EDLIELRVSAGVVLEKVEVLLEGVEVELARAGRETFLEEVFRRVVEPDAGAFVDLFPEQPEDIVRELDVMVQRKAERGHEKAAMPCRASPRESLQSLLRACYP